MCLMKEIPMSDQLPSGVICSAPDHGFNVNESTMYIT